MAKAPKTPKMVTAAVLGHRLGITARAVRAAVDDGRITPSQTVGKKYFFDIEQASMEYFAHTTPQANQMARVSNVESTVPDYNTSRAKREALQAELAQLELDEKSGKLVKREVVEKCAADAATITKNAILRVPDRIADELASCSDPHKVYNILLRELNEALQEMVDAQQRALGLLGEMA